MTRYKLVAEKGELTRHQPFEKLIDLFNQADTYRANGFTVKTYIKKDEEWEEIEI